MKTEKLNFFFLRYTLSLSILHLIFLSITDGQENYITTCVKVFVIFHTKYILFESYAYKQGINGSVKHKKS